jgi:hypothetical protein
MSAQPSPARFLLEVSGAQLDPEDLGRIHENLDGSLQNLLAPEGVTAKITGLWNTGCRQIAWDGEDGGVTGTRYPPIHIVDGEAQGSSITLQEDVPLPFHVYFPWCNSWNEVWSKALRVYQGADASTTPVTYIFQEYRTSLVRYIQYSDVGNGAFPGNATPIYKSPASYFDLMIQSFHENGKLGYFADGTPSGILGPPGGF